MYLCCLKIEGLKLQHKPTYVGSLCHGTSLFTPLKSNISAFFGNEAMYGTAESGWGAMLMVRFTRLSLEKSYAQTSRLSS